MSIRYPYFGMQEGDCESTDGVEDQDHAFVGRRKVVELGSRLARAGRKWIRLGVLKEGGDVLQLGGPVRTLSVVCALEVVWVMMISTFNFAPGQQFPE